MRKFKVFTVEEDGINSTLIEARNKGEAEKIAKSLDAGKVFYSVLVPKKMNERKLITLMNKVHQEVPALTNGLIKEAELSFKNAGLKFPDEQRKVVYTGMLATNFLVSLLVGGSKWGDAHLKTLKARLDRMIAEQYVSVSAVNEGAFPLVY